MADETFIDFKCPYCGFLASFPEDCAGRANECPECLETIVVPNDGSEVGHKLPIPITTPRLTLRRLRQGDWKDLLEFLADAETFRYSPAEPMDEEGVVRWLEADAAAQGTHLSSEFSLAIVLESNNKLIGHGTVSFPDQQRLQAILDVFLNRHHQRNGYATEVVRALLDFCFQGIGLHRVAVSCDSRNVAAQRLFAKAGLRREGEFLQSHFVKGEWADKTWFALLKSEYLAKSSGTAQSKVD